jgi:hypothetical protein
MAFAGGCIALCGEQSLLPGSGRADSQPVIEEAIVKCARSKL